jgi:hypothetical protein
MAEGEKLGSKDIYAVALVFIIAFGIWNFTPKDALPEFSSASQIRLALVGKAVQPHIALAAALEGQYASLSGMDAASAIAITSFLLSFPPILLALSCAFFFIGLRLFGQGLGWSAFAAVLFATSLASFGFLPGVYSGAQVACLLFSASFACLALFAMGGKDYAGLAGAAAFVLGAGYFFFAYGIAAACLALFFLLRERKGKPASMAPYALMLLACLAGIALSPSIAKAYFSPEKLLLGISAYAPFVLAAASICACLAAMGAVGKEWLLIVAAGILLFGVDASSGAALLLLPIAHGTSVAFASEKKGALLLASYSLCFFMLLAIAHPLFFGFLAVALAGLVAFLGPLVLHLYEYNTRGFFSGALFALFCLSVFFAALAQETQKAEGYPQYIGKDYAASITFLAGQEASSAIVLERQDAADFYLQGWNVVSGSEAEEALLAGSGMASGSYAVLSPLLVEKLSSAGGFEAYYYAGNYSANSRQYRLFASGKGRLISREIGSDGEYALRDAAFVDSYGRQYANVPLSGMAFLLGGKNASDPAEVLLVMSEGGSPPAFVGLASGKGAKIAFKSGSSVVLEVE